MLSIWMLCLPLINPCMLLCNSSTREAASFCKRNCIISLACYFSIQHIFRSMWRHVLLIATTWKKILKWFPIHFICSEKYLSNFRKVFLRGSEPHPMWKIEFKPFLCRAIMANSDQKWPNYFTRPQLPTCFTSSPRIAHSCFHCPTCCVLPSTKPKVQQSPETKPARPWHCYLGRLYRNVWMKPHILSVAWNGLAGMVSASVRILIFVLRFLLMRVSCEWSLYSAGNFSRQGFKSHSRKERVTFKISQSSSCEDT